MFARVNYNRSIRDTLYYNEQKLRLGKAECLLAENFLKDPDRLSGIDKLYHFKRRHELNDVAKANTPHISVSFHPSDKIDNELMKELSRKYMEKLGLHRQPWLAYRHYDAGHPHVHIVSTLIRPDGSRLKLDDILRYQSLKATMQIERQYPIAKFYRLEGLPAKQFDLSPPRRLNYGEPERKEAMERVLDHVINKYHFNSLAEFNAVLKLYNVKAKIVWENQALNKAKGLMYHSLDEKGRTIGVAFKSSSFPSRPTLKKLEQQFRINQSLHLEQSRKVTLSIDWVLFGKSIDWETFSKNLLRENIHTILENDEKGEWRNIYYVDVARRCVYDGDALVDRYTCQSIRARCINEEHLRLEQSQKLINQQHLKIRL